MPKLTREQVREKTQQWARLTQKIAQVEGDKKTATVLLVRKLENACLPYDNIIDPLQAKADAIELEILEWLGTQKKSVRLESKNAIAEFIKSTKLGDRVVNAMKFVEMATERKIKDFWKYVRVTIKDAELVLGKDDLAAICTRPQVKSEIASLTLKN